MKVFKFGGASTKDAAGVRNVFSVVKNSGEKQLLIVVSAMGKMTNALEVVVNDYFETGNYKTALRNVYDFHDRILKDLFPAPDHPVFSEVQELFEEVHLFLTTNKSGNHAFVYDQVVSLGELVSSKIVRRYFVENGLPAAWL